MADYSHAWQKIWPKWPKTLSICHLPNFHVLWERETTTKFVGKFWTKGKQYSWMSTDRPISNKKQQRKDVQFIQKYQADIEHLKHRHVTFVVQHGYFVERRRANRPQFATTVIFLKSGILSQIWSGTRPSMQSVSNICRERIYSLDTSAFSALEIFDDTALYKSTYLLTFDICCCRWAMAAEHFWTNLMFTLIILFRQSSLLSQFSIWRHRLLHFLLISVNARTCTSYLYCSRV